MERGCWLVAKSCVPFFLWPRDFCPWISQTRILEWVAIPFSRGSSWPRDWTHISCVRQALAGGFFTAALQGKPTPFLETRKWKPLWSAFLHTCSLNNKIVFSDFSVIWRNPAWGPWCSSVFLSLQKRFRIPFTDNPSHLMFLVLVFSPDSVSVYFRYWHDYYLHFP